MATYMIIDGFANTVESVVIRQDANAAIKWYKKKIIPSLRDRFILVKKIRVQR